MNRAKNIHIIFLILIIITGITQTKLCLADNYGIGQFSITPDSFPPEDGELVTIKGVVYHHSLSGMLFTPQVTVVINDELNLPVIVNMLSDEIIKEDPLERFGEWKFNAEWNGINEMGELFAPGKYAVTISLDLPNIGTDTKTGIITIHE
ncbi:MAG: hypothetical protein ABH952_09995 [Candidatus Omnitrophota bacterium]